jgi:hypothetical protein
MTDEEIKAAASAIPLDKQIAAVRREIALRKNVYPSFIARGKMKQAEADHQLAAMQAVHDTLTMWSIIEELRTPEGHTVTLICDNPDFNGQPNCAVDVCGDWTVWVDERFAADTILGCLLAAKAARDAAPK